MIGASSFLSGCATSEPQDCMLFQAIRPSKADVLTDGTVTQILEHNKVGKAICGWE